MTDYTYYGLYDLEKMINSIYNILTGGLGIVAMLGAIATMVAALLLSIAQWVLLAIPLYNLAKKTGRKYAWLAWIPVFGDYFRMFTLSDIPGEKEFVLFGKIRIKNRFLSFWIWVGIMLFGNLVWDVVLSFLGTLLTYTFVGPIFTTVLGLVPDVLIGFMEYVYMRDVLDVFKEDKKSNNVWAIVVTVLDAILPWRFAGTVCLYTLLKCDPIPEHKETETAPVLE